MNRVREFQRIGVVGLGLMGTGIVQVAATAGYATTAIDTEQNLVDRAMDRVAGSLRKMVEKSLLPEAEEEATFCRIQASTDLTVLTDCDLIIEAVYEDLQIKRNLFRHLDEMCPLDTVFASNTSSLPVTALASGLRRVDKFVGLHFFNPVPIMNLVEVVKTTATSHAVVERVRHFVASLEKKPILVRDQAGFLVNYLLTPYLFDAIRSLSSGLGTVGDIDSSMRLGCGHPMGPLALSDLIGLDTLAKAGNILFEEYRESRYATPPLLKRLVDMGDLGKKSGRGFYDYHESEKPRPRDLAGF